MSIQDQNQTQVDPMMSVLHFRRADPHAEEHRRALPRAGRPRRAALLRVRHGGRHALLGQVVQGRQRVLQVCGQAGAENGQLTIMCGGSDEAFSKAAPVMNAYAKQITHIGEAGAGQTTKMVNQICIAGVVQGLSEGIAFAQNAGLDPAKVIEAISKGAAQSWQMENRWKTMVDGKFDYGFAVDWMRKDLRIALEEARNNGSSLPVTALVDQFYAEVQASGGKRWDTSSLITRLAVDKDNGKS